MRNLSWLAALVAALASCEAAQAQGFGTNQSPTTNRLSSPARTGYISPSNKLSSGFRLRDLFPSFSGISNRTPIATSKIPEPGSAEYFKAFGFKKLY